MGHTHRYKFGFKKKNQVKSPSIWSCTPKSVPIRQSGRTGNRGVTMNSLLVSASAPNNLWGGAILSACHLQIEFHTRKLVRHPMS